MKRIVIGVLAGGLSLCALTLGSRAANAHEPCEPPVTIYTAPPGPADYGYRYGYGPGYRYEYGPDNGDSGVGYEDRIQEIRYREHLRWEARRRWEERRLWEEHRREEARRRFWFEHRYDHLGGY